MEPRFAFVCAAGHSGSTLLDLMLGAHPDGISAGEVTQLPKNIAMNSKCSCGQQLSQGEFWRRLIREYSRSLNSDLWVHPYSLNLGFIRAGREIDFSHQTRSRMAMRKLAYGAEFLHLRWHVPVPAFINRTIRDGARNKQQFFRFILDQTGRRFIVDSSKHYIEALNLYLAAPMETRIIWLLRDGRAVFNSGLRRGMSPARAVDSWATHNRRFLKLLDGNLPKSCWLTVRYEDLATDADAELRRISEFLEIGYDPLMLDFGETESHIANGNRMRFNRSSEVRFDQEWRNTLSDDSLRFFERRAGKLNRQLGYGD
jgi:hypothetical protein